jgi:F0F1-type ATP synthase gamma subunit
MFKRSEPINPKRRWKFNSRIGQNRSWGNYYSQYKNVIDDIVNGIEDKTPIDTVSLPLLFLIRHSLEVGLKDNILKLEAVNDKVAKIELRGTKYHSIEVLYNKFVQHLNTIKKNFRLTPSVVKEIDDYLNKFEPLKEKFHKLDNGSFNFRYPVDTEGNYNFNWNEEENLADIIDMYYSIQPFLAFTGAVLYEEGVFGFED